MLSITDFNDLRQYLRGFTNFQGESVPYDHVGLFHLLSAIIDNLQVHAIEQDLEDLGALLTEDQAAFLSRVLLAHAASRNGAS